MNCSVLPDNLNGGRGVQRPDYPDCRNGGPHRPGKAHPWHVDRSVFYQTCRKCGLIKFTRMTVKDGIAHAEIITPGTKTVLTSDDKSSPDTGESKD